MSPSSAPPQRAAHGAAWHERARALLLAALPHHALSRVIFRATRWRTPLARPVMRWFARRFGADLEEAAERDLGRYESFNAFFTRALRSGARPLDPDPSSLVCPVDGRVSQAGTLDGERLLQAKGIHYSLTALLGGDPVEAERFRGGTFATLYLAPGDYHRIHMPASGTLRRMTYVPGRLFSVAPWTTRSVPGLFPRNERVCALFDTAHGPLALVLVGAINVAAIETVWAGLVTPPRGRRVADWVYDRGKVELARGEEMGRFNMGSTVIVVAPAGTEVEASRLPGSRVRVGQPLLRAAAVGSHLGGSDA